MTKRALIVDDSKTARQVLSGKLSKYGISVMALESAAAAIDFLYENAPDAIFMDYEMPGMDGFQALKVIKSNPNTAVIPVMMYTSKAGGLEVSQARALGAVGVLPKQLEVQDLEDVLRSLHLMPDQESLVPGFEDSELESVRTVRRQSNIHSITEHERRKSATVEPVSLPMDGVLGPLPTGDDSLKRFIRKEQNLSEIRLQEKLEKHFAETQSELYELEALQEVSRFQARRAQILGGISLLFILVGFAITYYFLVLSPAQKKAVIGSDPDSEAIYELISAQNEQIEQMSRKIEETGYGSVATPGSLIPVDLIEWAANQGTEFEYGEIPFNDQRALWLAELVDQLKEAGFRGTIELRATHGNYCLQKSEGDEYVLANDGLVISECLFAADHRDSNDYINGQSVAFANYMNVELARSGGELEILLFSSGFNDPLIPYPSVYEVKTAKEWNRIATQNQRVRVSLYSNL
ncbi:MAG: response regulator [Candidatus Thiodiazotropha sp. (ex Lucina aurantia)]|nr:response regulator [Candidatus Thiodiazotropha sp. (ex Lucina pensylvanica)]MBT3024987.1 response regulator [Candidatus Thiodiazotropha taylori]MBV2099892.1 response regulator [Candidatus Thiodiazotropha sp. (ex Codakia orbicularis)]MBV2101421.1 response regulator [Candidatus Thiodiazotropha sp. (ex Lucina aurantia)]MBV2115826.1 response regulator [Candidatus Thiodiazotropha sp. (ex Lucina aurantia)]